VNKRGCPLDEIRKINSRIERVNGCSKPFIHVGESCQLMIHVMRMSAVSKVCWFDQLHVNFNLPKSHMHIFNVSITAQGLKNVSQNVQQELICNVLVGTVYAKNSGEMKFNYKNIIPLLIFPYIKVTL
jgi:hypothetical protein